MKKYAIVVERAERNYAAYVPDLPGCVATGATVAEAEALLREAIEVHIAGLREDGLPVPPRRALSLTWKCRSDDNSGGQGVEKRFASPAN
jgi:predicted RNase H-like HicB family nuclease